MENVSKEVCEERHKAIEQYLGNDKAKLLKHDVEIKTVGEAVILLTSLTERHENELRDHETRIRGIEARPGKRWDSVTGQIIMILVAAAVGGFFGRSF